MLPVPRTVKPLTDTQIKNAKPKVKEYNLADGQGLYLRIKPSGADMPHLTGPVLKLVYAANR
jgi:hypothetical protein